MYYVNCYTFFEEPEKEWLRLLEKADMLMYYVYCYTFFEEPEKDW